LYGHEVYDFRNPAPGNTGFSWSSIDPDWLRWGPETFNKFLETHPIAASGFKCDKDALDWADTCILVLPCGRSAHLELGYAAGQGKDTYVLLHEDKFEPELMYLLNTARSTSIDQIIGWMLKRQPGDALRWHVESGAHFKRPANHALRLLREAVELCVATGATSQEIREYTEAEIDKSDTRGEFGGNPTAVPGELADVRILLDVFAGHAGIDVQRAVRAKIDVLWERSGCSPDSGGALYRQAKSGVRGDDNAT
jgi:hypothetical protein